MKKPAIKTDLPPGVIASDLRYPTTGRSVGDLTFYFTNRFGWCVATLSINSRGRTYGITMDGNIVSMGGRPDDKIVYAYVSEARQAALQKFLDLKAKGLGNAGDIRDRIGSRRAEGQVKRAQGLHSWRWDA
jgi:hypothetical protein